MCLPCIQQILWAVLYFSLNVAYIYQYGTKVIFGQPIDNNFVANDAVNELLIFSFHFARFIQNHSFVVIDPTCDGFRQILFASKKPCQWFRIFHSDFAKAGMAPSLLDFQSILPETFYFTSDSSCSSITACTLQCTLGIRFVLL